MEKTTFFLFLRILFVVLLAFFLLSILPILILGFYSVPAADDYSYGYAVYHAVQSGASLPGILSAAFHNIEYAYEHWQGTHSGVFLMSLQPAVFGERYYALTPLIMLLSLCGSLFVFCRMIFFRFLHLPKLLSDCIWLFSTILCVQLSPSPTESFFWYNGSVYYTFYHGLFLCTFSLCFLYLLIEKKVFLLSVLCLFGIILGGGNYVTALQTAVVGVSGICLLAVFRRREWKDFLLPLFLFFISFLLSIKAPGNAVRQAEVAYTPNALHAILSSFYYCAKDCLHWFSPPVLAVLLVLFPLIWNSLSADLNIQFFPKVITEEKNRILFRCPFLLTLYSYCLLSAMYCPPFYAMDGIPERAVNIIYYTYIPLVVINEVWWIGWFLQKKARNIGVSTNSSPEYQQDHRYEKIFSVKAILFCTLIAVFLCGSYLFYGKINPGKAHLTSVLALHDLRSGEAAEYRAAYEKRFEQLHDASIQNVVMEPVSVYPILLSGGDFSEDPDNWTNHSLATYYMKESVRVASVSD